MQHRDWSLDFDNLAVSNLSDVMKESGIDLRFPCPEVLFQLVGCPFTVFTVNLRQTLLQNEAQTNINGKKRGR